MDTDLDPTQPLSMPFGDHLEELRRRLIIILLSPIPFIIVGFFFGQPLIEWLWEPCRRVLEANDLPSQMQVLSPTEAFIIWMKVSIILGFVITSPVVVYQTWAFVAPGLYTRERRFAYLLVPMSTILVIAGLAFLYIVLIPVSMNFLVSFGSGFTPPERTAQVEPTTEAPLVVPFLGEDPEQPVEGQVWFKLPENQLRIAKDGVVLVAPFSAKTLLSQQIQLHRYINMVLVLSLVFPLAFQLPVVMMLLGWSGLVGPEDLKGLRRFALFGCAIAGAMLTPADPWSMLALALPLYGLYELGVVLMRVLPASRVSEGLFRGQRTRDQRGSDEETSA